MADKQPALPEWAQIEADEAAALAAGKSWPPRAPAVAIRWVKGRPESFPGVGTQGRGDGGTYTPAETKAYLTKAQFDAGLAAGFLERVDPPAPADPPPSDAPAPDAPVGA